MAKLRIRLKINAGRHGAPMSKLGRIAEQAERFLVALATDCEVETRAGEWLAVDFENSSVAYNAEFQGDVNAAVVSIFARNLEILADYDPDKEGLNLAIKEKTAIEYAKIGSLIDPDEFIGLGIYGLHSKVPKWRQITYSKSQAIKREFETPLPTYGAVQGIIHSWAKEAQKPHFVIRELATEALVRVYYGPLLYSSVAKSVQERSTVLIVSGNMLFDRASRQATELNAERIDTSRMLSAREFEDFFGSAPEYRADSGYLDG